MPSERGWFETVLGFVGKRVEVATRRGGEMLSGTVVNTMFDSFLLRTDSGNHVITFRDIMLVQPLDAVRSADGGTVK
jgi:hypothetical protein